MPENSKDEVFGDVVDVTIAALDLVRGAGAAGLPVGYIRPLEAWAPFVNAAMAVFCEKVGDRFIFKGFYTDGTYMTISGMTLMKKK